MSLDNSPFLILFLNSDSFRVLTSPFSTKLAFILSNNPRLNSVSKSFIIFPSASILQPEAASFSSSTQMIINWLFSILKEDDNGLPCAAQPERKSYNFSAIILLSLAVKGLEAG